MRWRRWPWWRRRRVRWRRCYQRWRRCWWRRWWRRHSRWWRRRRRRRHRRGRWRRRHQRLEQCTQGRKLGSLAGHRCLESGQTARRRTRVRLRQATGCRDVTASSVTKRALPKPQRGSGCEIGCSMDGDAEVERSQQQCLHGARRFGRLQDKLPIGGSTPKPSHFAGGWGLVVFTSSGTDNTFQIYVLHQN